MIKKRRRLRAGQHVVITGGSSGLGLEIAHQLAPRGLELSLVARDIAKLEAARDEVTTRTPGARVEIVSADVSDPKALSAAFERIAAVDPIDVLINSAGIIREGYFETLTDADYRAAMEINLFGTINAVKAALPSLKVTRGRVVNIASVAGLGGVFGFSPYCASKHALVGFTNSISFELEPQGVTVQLVCPAEFLTPMVDALDATRTPENFAHTNTIPRIPVPKIAEETVRGIDHADRHIVPGFRTRAFVTGLRHLPGLSAFIGRRRIAAVYQGPPATPSAAPSADSRPR